MVVLGIQPRLPTRQPDGDPNQRKAARRQYSDEDGGDPHLDILAGNICFGEYYPRKKALGLQLRLLLLLLFLGADD